MMTDNEHNKIEARLDRLETLVEAVVEALDIKPCARCGTLAGPDLDDEIPESGYRYCCYACYRHDNGE